MEIRKLIVKIESKFSTLILINAFLSKIFANNVRNIQKMIHPKLLLLAGDVELNPGPYDAGIVFHL